MWPDSTPTFLLPNRTSEGNLQGLVIVGGSSAGAMLDLGTTNSSDLDHWLRLDLKSSRYGYGYHWHGTPSNNTIWDFSSTHTHGNCHYIHLISPVSHSCRLWIRVRTWLIYLDIMASQGPLSMHLQSFYQRNISWRWFLNRGFFARNPGGGFPKVWETIPELFVLSINSRHSEKLINTSAEIKQSETWGVPIAVREQDGRTSRLLLKAMRCSSSLVRGWAYHMVDVLSYLDSSLAAGESSHIWLRCSICWERRFFDWPSGFHFVSFWPQFIFHLQVRVSLPLLIFDISIPWRPIRNKKNNRI